MKGKIILLTIFMMAGLVGTGNSQTGNTNSQTQTGDTSLKIIKKPVAEIRGTNCSQSTGRISMRVTFDKSAKVTDTEIIKASGCDNFDNNAVSAAQKIKFSPAIKNGEAVTTVKIIFYKFEKY